MINKRYSLEALKREWASLNNTYRAELKKSAFTDKQLVNYWLERNYIEAKYYNVCGITYKQVITWIKVA